MLIGGLLRIMEQQPNNEPHARIWIGTKRTFDDGILHGEWVDAELPPLDLVAAIGQVLSTSPVEDDDEFIIAATDGFGDLRIDPEFPISEIKNVAEKVRIHGQLFIEYCRLLQDVGKATATFDWAYLGILDDYVEVGEQLLDRLGIRATFDEAFALLPPYLRTLIIIDGSKLLGDFQYRLRYLRDPDDNVHVFVLPL